MSSPCSVPASRELLIQSACADFGEEGCQIDRPQPGFTGCGRPFTGSYFWGFKTGFVK